MLKNIYSNNPTFGEILEKNRGVGPGFNALRIGLAVLILVYHSARVSYGFYELKGALYHPFVIALVPMFFCLSGILVTGSALRTKSVSTFLTFRSLRIFPALMVEVTLSAIILGPLLTTVSLQEYFSDKHFFSYLGNIVGRIRYLLPGVFTNNPIPGIVNGNLWTLQPEFYCYLIMAGLMLIKIIYHRNWYSTIFIGLSAAIFALDFIYKIGQPGAIAPWHVVLYSFFVGIFMYHWKDELPMSPILFWLAAGVAYFALPIPGLTYILVLLLAYCVAYIGTINIRPLPLIQKGDYSYGVYLFSYPIQQTLAYCFPALREWWLMFFVSAPLSFMFAAFSWHWIEKPALGLKKKFERRQQRMEFRPVHGAKNHE